MFSVVFVHWRDLSLDIMYNIMPKLGPRAHTVWRPLEPFRMHFEGIELSLKIFRNERKKEKKTMT